MSGFVNPLTDEMVGKFSSVQTVLGRKKSIDNGHRTFQNRLGAERAVEKIEAAMKRKRKQE